MEHLLKPGAAKPILPDNIETIDQAKAFLKLLQSAGWLYDPDGDAFMYDFPEPNAPNVREKKRLNKLMDAICGLESPGIFSPWDYYNELQSAK